MDSDRDTKLIRDLASEALNFPTLEFYLSPLYSTQTPQYRQEIRLALAQRFPDHADALKDVAKIPVHDRHSISISHSRQLGGFAIVPLPLRIGFDIEETARVTEQIALRMRVPGDEVAPGPAHLWVAKEAAFKCQLLGQQPKTSSEMVIREWTPSGLSNYLFRAKAPESGTDLGGYGFVTEYRLHLMCFFADASQLKFRSADRFTSTRE